MRTVQWIHFSDLHLNQGGVETRRLRKNLPAYLRGLGIYCGYAFFTGDLRYAPAGRFSENSMEQIREICDAVHTPIDHLFLVPGNHDVNRDAPGREEAVYRVHNAADQNHPGYYQPRTGTIKDDDLASIAAGRQDFCELIKTLYANVPERADCYLNSSRPHFVLTSEDFNMIHLDSTLTYTKAQQQQLIVGTNLLMDVLEQLDPTKPAVLLTHYSFDFLHRDEQRELIELLHEYNVQLWLAGHEHDHLCRKQWDKFYEFQCGNLVLEEGAASCVLIGTLDLDTGAGEVRAHAWFPGKGWAEYPFIRTGSSCNSVYPFQLHWKGSAAPPSIPPESENVLAACGLLEAAGGQFSRTELLPSLLPDLQWEQEIFDNEPGTIPLISAMDVLWNGKQRVGQSCHALLLGDGGMGKSTMMFHACKLLIQERHRLAVFASLQTLQSAGLSMERHLLRTLYRAEDEPAKGRLLALMGTANTEPNITLLVDGFNELNSDTAYQYVAELKRLSQYPGIQIVVSSRLDFLRNYGMTHFQMLRTCDLRDKQLQALFDPEQWPNILGKRYLHILLKNPMMALLYAQTYPLIDQYRDLPYCDWRLPISTAADLLHDYYLSQVVLMADRENADKKTVYFSFCTVRYLLPLLALHAESQNVMGWPDAEFTALFTQAVQETEHTLTSGPLPDALLSIKRSYRLALDRTLPEDTLYDVILSGLCLLRSGRGFVSFHHQIFRDYLAAVHLYNSLTRSQHVPAVWHERSIHAGVIQYLRHMHGDLWGAAGLMTRLLAPYRGKEAAAGDHLVENLINCWLQADAEANVARDLSELDFRHISLADHLKRPFNGSILLHGARVSRQTFVNERRHDRISGLAFSHDGRTLAAISANGIVSVSNILTQSQMIVGEFHPAGNTARIGYTAEDYLMLETGGKSYIWPTIAYDKIEAARPSDSILSIQAEFKPDHASHLQKMLKDSRLLGEQHIISDDRRLLAVGHSSGHIQVWDAREQVCVAELSLGDSQVVTASFSPGGEYAALCAGGPLVQLWSIRQQQCLGVLHFERPIRRVRFPSSVNFQAAPYLECEYSNGHYIRINIFTGRREEYQNPQKLLQIQKELRRRLKGKTIQKVDLADNGNAIIMERASNRLWTWNQATHALNPCQGHLSPILDIAVCRADPRYAASYSDEKFHARWKQDRRLEGEKLVRAWAIRKGTCMQRLTTNHRTIKRLQFFTANRIILAAFATNGDIILWELVNKFVHGEEHGHWHPIDTVRNSPAEPLECAVSTRDNLFIGVYTNGTLFSRTFSGRQVSSLQVFPGIDLTHAVWDDLVCDDDLKEILRHHQNSAD